MVSCANCFTKLWIKVNFIEVLHNSNTQLSPETFDPRKMDANFLEANFEYFRLSTARDDKSNENCPSYFLVFGLKSC